MLNCFIIWLTESWESLLPVLLILFQGTFAVWSWLPAGSVVLSQLWCLFPQLPSFHMQFWLQCNSCRLIFLNHFSPISQVSAWQTDLTLQSSEDSGLQNRIRSFFPSTKLITLREIIRNFKFLMLHLLQVDSRERRVKEVGKRRDVFHSCASWDTQRQGKMGSWQEPSNYVSASRELTRHSPFSTVLHPDCASVLPLSDFSGLKSQT